MKIANVQATYVELPLAGPFRPTWPPVAEISNIRTCLIRMETDGGIVGWGAGPTNSPIGARLLGEYLGQMVVGMDPMRIELIAERMSPTADMFSWPWCIEMAAWDIKGKALGQSVSDLLGGYTHRLRGYASFGERRDAQTRVQDVANAVEHNFTAMKLRFRADNVRDDLAVVAAVRDAYGMDVDLMVDANQGTVNTSYQDYRVWTPKLARYVADALYEMGVLWLEEPLPKRQYGNLSWLTKNTEMSIAGGEVNLGNDEFGLLIREHCYDILQLDVAFSEGIWNCRKIAAAAEVAGLVALPHTWSNGLALVANFHLAAALPHAQWLEVPFDPPSFSHEARDAILKQTLTVDEDGMVTLPAGPGFGVEIDEEFVAAHTVEA